VWLPPGDWYDFWTDERVVGGRAIDVAAPTGKLPLFVKGGAIVPRAISSNGTGSWDRTTRLVDTYAGASGSFSLHEDDGISEAHLTGARSITTLRSGEGPRLEIAAEDGSYAGAPAARTYVVRFHGVSERVDLALNAAPIANATTDEDARKTHGAFYDAAAKTITVYLAPNGVRRPLVIEPRSRQGDAGVSPAGGPDAGAPGSAAGQAGCGCRTANANGSLAAALMGALVSVAALVGRRSRRTAKSQIVEPR
jgi:hypothetical protein